MVGRRRQRLDEAIDAMSGRSADAAVDTLTGSEPCRRVRSGMGTSQACRTHGRPWPCRIGEQPYEQLAMLRQASPLAIRVILEIAEERVHQLEIIEPRSDEAKQAGDWIALAVDYLNRASQETYLLRQREEAGAELDTSEWRRRLVQVAAITAACVEWCDRVTSTVGDPS